MGKLQISEWRKLPISLTELCIDTTLRCGQSFRWRKLNQDEWTCTLHGRILALRQDATHLHYRATWPKLKEPLLIPPTSASFSTVDTEDGHAQDDTELLIRRYFNLDLNLAGLYEQWSQADPNFKKRAPKFTGIRILRQDAWEALVCFICSSCNNIPRIMQMVEKLCINYGPIIGHITGKPFHDFPSPENLAGDGVEARLRELGFGYRAKYLAQTARLIAREKPADWLINLSNPEKRGLSECLEIKPGGRDGYRQAYAELLKLQGVGPKVADCVCLMGLGWGESVPVDTHVWQIAQRDYKFGKGKHKSLTKATYDEVADHFRGLWGKEAGWAQSVLFTDKILSGKPAVKVKEDGVKIEQEVKMRVKKEFGEEEVKVTVTVKREINEEEEEEEKEEEEKKLVIQVVESSRSQRAKRRRMI